MQYGCEGCVVEGISGWNGRHGGEKDCAVFRRHETFALAVWLIDEIFRVTLILILIDLYRCKCTKCMVVWRDYHLECQNNFIMYVQNFSLKLLVHQRKQTAFSSPTTSISSCTGKHLLSTVPHKAHKFIALGNAQFVNVTAGNNVHNNRHTVTRI